MFLKSPFKNLLLWALHTSIKLFLGLFSSQVSWVLEVCLKLSTSKMKLNFYLVYHPILLYPQYLLSQWMAPANSQLPKSKPSRCNQFVRALLFISFFYQSCNPLLWLMQSNPDFLVYYQSTELLALNLPSRAQVFPINMAATSSNPAFLQPWNPHFISYWLDRCLDLYLKIMKGEKNYSATHTVYNI